MTNAIHANSLRTRIAHEIAAAKMNDNNVKKLQKTAAFFEQETVASFLATLDVDADFANKSALTNERFDVYSIDSMCSIMQFALNAISIDNLKTNVAEILQTLIALHKAEMTFTQDDAIISLTAKNKKIEIKDKEKAKLYVRRATAFDSEKRHAQMTINALVALNAISATSKNTYKMNENELTAKLIARFEA
jgi:hypothetical protein